MKRFLIRFVSLAARLVAPLGTPSHELLTVELLIFSGRPNPTFAVTDARVAREILATAMHLPADDAIEAGADALPESRLGYRGFMVRNHTAAFPDLGSFIAYRSAVELMGPAGTKADRARRLDTHAALENRLLAYAKKQRLLDDALLALIHA